MVINNNGARLLVQLLALPFHIYVTSPYLNILTSKMLRQTASLFLEHSHCSYGRQFKKTHSICQIADSLALSWNLGLSV